MVYLNPHFKEEKVEIGEEYFLFYKNQLRKEKLISIIDENIVKLNFTNNVTLSVDYSSFKDIESPIDNEIYIVKELDSFMFFCIMKKETNSWKNLDLKDFLKNVEELTTTFTLKV